MRKATRIAGHYQQHACRTRPGSASREHCSQEIAYIVEHHEYEQCENERKSCAKDVLLGARTERAPLCGLPDIDDNLTTVQNRDRKQVEDSELAAQEREQRKQSLNAGPGPRTGDLRHRIGPAQVLHALTARKHRAKDGYYRTSRLPTSISAQCNGLAK